MTKQIYFENTPEYGDLYIDYIFHYDDQPILFTLKDDFSNLLDNVKKVLSDDFSFLLISCYTTGISHISLENILKQNFPNCKIETGENCLPVTEDNLILPCGIYGKVTKN